MALPTSLPIDEVVTKFKELKDALEAYYQYKLTGIHLHIHTWADPFERCSCEVMVHVKPVYVSINFSEFRDWLVDDLVCLIGTRIDDEVKRLANQNSYEKEGLDKLVKFLERKGD